jgi:hypothetical protein
MVFTKYPHEGITFFLGLSLLFFRVKKGVFGLSARLESIF